MYWSLFARTCGGLKKKVSLHCDEAGVWVFLEWANEFADLCRNVARLFCIECSFSDDVASQLASNDFKIEQLSICTKARNIIHISSSKLGNIFLISCKTEFIE